MDGQNPYLKTMTGRPMMCTHFLGDVQAYSADKAHYRQCTFLLCTSISHPLSFLCQAEPTQSELQLLVPSGKHVTAVCCCCIEARARNKQKITKPDILAVDLPETETSEAEIVVAGLV